jgi:hypothetical protein
MGSYYSIIIICISWADTDRIIGIIDLEVKHETST